MPLIGQLPVAHVLIKLITTKHRLLSVFHPLAHSRLSRSSGGVLAQQQTRGLPHRLLEHHLVAYSVIHVSNQQRFSPPHSTLARSPRAPTHQEAREEVGHAHDEDGAVERRLGRRQLRQQLLALRRVLKQYS